MATEFDQLTDEEYRRWLHSRAPQHAVALTVTFRRSVKERDAQSALTHYCKMLNQKAFGNYFKSGKCRLAIIPVQEGGEGVADKRIHYHMQIEIPERWSLQAWMEAVVKKIKKIDVFGHEQYEIKPVFSSGWLDYCFKGRDKKSLRDAVEVSNLWLN